MSLNDLINVSISASATLPSQANFGVPLVAVYHTHYADLVRYYSDLPSLVADGFTVLDNAYKAVSEILDQNPTVAQYAIGRRTSVDLQVLQLTLTSTSALDTYKATFVDQAGASHNLSVASTGVPATDGPTVATAITGFTLAGCTVTHSGAVVTLTHTAGNFTDIQAWNVLNNQILQLADTTVDPGLATDLNNILAADNGWYGLCLGNNSPALVEAAMGWVETNKKLGAFNCSDTGIILATGGNVALATMASGYSRSIGIYSGSQLKSFAGAAALGRNFPPLPGSETWAYKDLTGVTADKLTQNAINNVIAANWNYFTTIKGSRVMIPGWSPVGEFIDIVQGIDWFTDLLQTDLLALFVGTSKVPFTDAGGDQVLAVIKSDLQHAVQQDFADPGDETTPAPSAFVPKVATISASNRAARKFVGSTFSFKLAGAIQSLTLTGTVTA